MDTMAATLAHELNQPLTAIAQLCRGGAAANSRDSAKDQELLVEIFEEMGT